MERYFILAGVEQEGKDGKYAIADDCFDVHASLDGLWLYCPKIDGVQDCINLLQQDKDRLKQMLEKLWRDMGGVEK